MDKKERLNQAYNYLKYKGIIRSQSDLAEKMNASQPNISAALSGVPRVLTSRFLRRFNEAVENIFSLDWLLTGEGEMLAPQPMAGSVSVSPELLERLYSELHNLRQEVADLRKEVAALRVNNYNYAPSLSMFADSDN